MKGYLQLGVWRVNEIQAIYSPNFQITPLSAIVTVLELTEGFNYVHLVFHVPYTFIKLIRFKSNILIIKSTLSLPYMLY